jgi:hypothetical protein
MAAVGRSGAVGAVEGTGMSGRRVELPLAPEDDECAVRCQARHSERQDDGCTLNFEIDLDEERCEHQTHGC